MRYLEFSPQISPGFGAAMYMMRRWGKETDPPAVGVSHDSEAKGQAFRPENCRPQKAWLVDHTPNCGAGSESECLAAMIYTILVGFSATNRMFWWPRLVGIAVDQSKTPI